MRVSGRQATASPSPSPSLHPPPPGTPKQTSVPPKKLVTIAPSLSISALKFPQRRSLLVHLERHPLDLDPLLLPQRLNRVPNRAHLRRRSHRSAQRDFRIVRRDRAVLVGSSVGDEGEDGGTSAGEADS